MFIIIFVSMVVGVQGWWGGLWGLGCEGDRCDGIVFLVYCGKWRVNWKFGELFFGKTNYF